uniref:Uncharacterized protein n=1 Tax=Tanacetum cinerariifolium TaxID=118510 RepID=A0A699TQ97_TANCI|nr:hypothetical protein [Tanacetum cinerariifolium]
MVGHGDMGRLQEVILSIVFPSSGAGALEEGSSHRSHGQNNDRHGSDRRGGNDNHRCSNNNNNYSSSNNRLNFKSMPLSSIHEHDPNTTL